MASLLPRHDKGERSLSGQHSKNTTIQQSVNETGKASEVEEIDRSRSSQHEKKLSQHEKKQDDNTGGALESLGDDEATVDDGAAKGKTTLRPNTNEEARPSLDDSDPPLPDEPPPIAAETDDGWLPVWEETAQAFYFYNRYTGATQWTNPRIPEPSEPGPPGVTVLPPAPAESTPLARPAGGYDPAVHGDYDPTAWYAQPAEPKATAGSVVDPAAAYTATGAFNRFTGRFQAPDIVPEKFNDESKSRNQMNAFFDVDAAANSHDGRSLKAERSGKKLSKLELKQFKEKRKAKKEEKRRAWLRD